MKKAELIEAVAEKTGLSKRDVGVALAEILETIKGALENGTQVQLPGFGSFIPNHRPARTMKVPSGEMKDIPAKTVAKFKPAKALKEL